jgi:hypothetical protein
MHYVLGLFRSVRVPSLFLLTCLSIFALSIPAAFALNLSDAEIATLQKAVQSRPIGERISFWAQKFVATPYDPDPLGEYVRRSEIVADERVDCMYHVFRSVELALSGNPADAVQVALDKRFHGRGVIKEGTVINYDDRFAYGEDMVFSGKWGRVVTDEVGPLSHMRGSRGIRDVSYIRKNSALSYGRLKPGDVIFFVRPVNKRKGNEIIGHMGIVSIDEKSGRVQLIHAGGVKGKGGAVKKVPLKTYLATMPFAGIMITRFE